MKVKAAVLSTRISFVKEKFGEQRFQRLLDCLPPRDKELLTGPLIFANNWLPLEIYIDFLAGVVKELNNGDESILVEMGKHAAQKQLTGIYRVFIKISSPEFFLKRVPQIFKLFYSSGEAVVKTAAPGTGRFIFKGFKKEHRLIEVTTLGWCKKAMELSGAKKIKGEITKSLARGEGYFEISGSWE